MSTTKYRYPKGPNKTEDRINELVDQLTEFEEFQALVPRLKELLKDQSGSEKIMKAMAPMAAARLINIAVTEPDAGKALSAIKEVLNRAEGVPTQKQEITHKLEKLDEDQLDSLLMSEIQSLEAMKTDDEKH